MELARSPLAPAHTQDCPAIAGARIATTNSGIRYKGRDDLLLLELSPGSTVAGVFTRSLASSAPGMRNPFRRRGRSRRLAR